MLPHICTQFAINFDVKFNVAKSIAYRICAYFDVPSVFFVLLRAELKFVNNIKYLDIYVCAGKHFKCLIKHKKLNFFRSFNCIIYHSKFAMSELVSVNLIKILLFTNIAVWV